MQRKKELPEKEFIISNILTNRILIVLDRDWTPTQLSQAIIEAEIATTRPTIPLKKEKSPQVPSPVTPNPTLHGEQNDRYVFAINISTTKLKN